MQLPDPNCSNLRRGGYTHEQFADAMNYIPNGYTTNGPKLIIYGTAAGEGRHWTFRERKKKKGFADKISIREAFCIEEGLRRRIYKVC